MSSDRETIVDGTAAANLNQAQNTVLHTYRVLKPVRIHRFGVVADAAAGLLAPMDLKLRHIPGTTGTAADITGAVLNGAVKARGYGLVKTLETRVGADYEPGDEIVIAVETAAGGTSTGDVWLELEPLPFQVESLDRIAEEGS